MTNYGSGMITGRIGHSGIAFMHDLHPRHRSHQVASSQDRPNVVATGCGDGQAGSGNKPGNTCRRGPGHKTQGSTRTCSNISCFFESTGIWMDFG